LKIKKQKTDSVSIQYPFFVFDRYAKALQKTIGPDEENHLISGTDFEILI